MQKAKTADSTSLVSQNVKIEGEIKGSENLHVEGFIKGAIAVSGDIFVGNTGILEADLEAKNIVIQGEVTGNVTAHQQLEIHPSGKLIGDCTVTSIDIKEGAVFEGRSMMMKPARAVTGRTPNPTSVQPQQTQKQNQPE
ncbi:MAG: polymer-forming cytoskeletal protein [Desulfobacterales bacterium]|jgi:cytoskeletal protein CcmA (bactofilin family)